MVRNADRIDANLLSLCVLIFQERHVKRTSEKKIPEGRASVGFFVFLFLVLVLVHLHTITFEGECEISKQNVKGTN